MMKMYKGPKYKIEPKMFWEKSKNEEKRERKSDPLI